MGRLLESLKRHYAETPQEVLDKEREERAYLNEIGPDVFEYDRAMKEYEYADETRQTGAKVIGRRLRLRRVSFTTVLAYMKRHTDFRYKAIRVRPHPRKFVSTNIIFPGGQMEIEWLGKVQICFFDQSLFIPPFRIAERHAYPYKP